MSDDALKLSRLIELAKTVRMSESQLAEQRNSFVYGNTRIENARVTREMVELAGSVIDDKRSDADRSR